MPGHKNLVNTDHEHRQRFQTVQTHRAGPGLLHLSFVLFLLAVLLIHNVDEFGIFLPSKMGFEGVTF